MQNVKKHLTPEQSHHILQFIGKNLDPYNTMLPTTEEARSFLYFQELLFLFISKEKKKQEKKGTGSKHKDGNHTFRIFPHFLFFYHFLLPFFYLTCFPFLWTLASKKDNNRKCRGSEGKRRGSEDPF
jgi:hypothetical protein